MSQKTTNLGPVAAFLVTIASLKGVPIVLSLVLTILIYLTGNDPVAVFEGWSDQTLVQFALNGAAYFGMLAAVYFFMRLRKISFADIGMSRKPTLKDVGFALITFAMYYGALTAVILFVKAFIPAVNVDQKQELAFNSATGLLPLLLVFVALVVLPPLIEEIMIRGFLYTGLRKKMTKVVAALIASLVFGIAHLQLETGNTPLYIAAIDTFVLSLFLIGLREKTGSLWSGIFLHALKNGLAFVLIFVLHVA